jgi:hypothetical protein
MPGPGMAPGPDDFHKEEDRQVVLKSTFAVASLAALSCSTCQPVLAGGFVLCNSLGGGSRVCTHVGDEGSSTRIENSPRVDFHKFPSLHPIQIV